MSIETQARAARQAALTLAGLTADEKNAILYAIAENILANATKILAANIIDLDNMADKDSPLYDRLTLSAKRIEGMVEGVNVVASLPDPVGEVTAEWTANSGIHIKKVRSPLGVIAIIYEARPNVTIDAAALCIKSGNAVILRGSRGAINSNRALFEVMCEGVSNAGFNPDIIQFIDNESRDSVKELLRFDNYIDVVIPRGGEELKKFILENSNIPVIASAGGNDHIYVEKSANFEEAVKVIVNAKCQRPSTCNAVEHILVDESIAADFIPMLYEALAEKNVTVLGDSFATEVQNEITLASDDDYHTEFLDYKLTISVVASVLDAIAHINEYGTRHSEAILSENDVAIDEFVKFVDAAAVYVNVSTRFTDGFEFGMGAEMGISTGKLQARGPIALVQLTSERYIIDGNYIVRK